MRVWPIVMLLWGTAQAATVHINGWTTRWTPQQATTSRAGHAITLYAQPKRCANGEQSKVLGAVLAVAPPYTSVYTNTENNCYASPAVLLAFATFDLDTGRPVSLLDLFKEQDVFQALKMDPYVKKVLVGQHPTSLDELLDDYGQGKPGCTNLDREGLTNFALYAVQGDKVAVRLGLPYSPSQTCNFGFDQLGLLLPAPPALLSTLKAGQNKGLLMQTLKRQTSLLP